MPPWKKGQSANPGGSPGKQVRVDVAYKKIIALPPEEFADFKPSSIAEVMALRQVTEAIASKKPLPYAQEITNRTDGPIVRKVEKVDLTALQVERERFELAVGVIMDKRGCSRADAVMAMAAVNPAYKKFLEGDGG